jgi:hypothetical protein
MCELQHHLNQFEDKTQSLGFKNIQNTKNKYFKKRL